MTVFALLLLSVGLVSGQDLQRRATGDKCNAAQGSGTCQATSDCKGISYKGYCPNDPTDIQCCVKTACDPPMLGVCQNTSKKCSGGSYVAGFCPGDSSIQCCPDGASAPSVPAYCSSPVPNTCYFYPNCLESKYHCGASGYPIGYGLHYCDKFHAAPMSAKGKKWVTDTMLCLQKALVPYATTSSTSCGNLKDVAFASHPHCYVDSGVCAIPGDWPTIVETVSLKDLFGSLDALKAVLKTVEGCVEFYEWLIARGIIKVVDEVEDQAKDVWDKVTSWF